jgi:hypothetical protein
MRTCWMQRRSGAGPLDAATRPRPDVVLMPRGPVVAAEAFAWLNRQLSWQSRLAELEGVRTRRRPAQTS